MGKLGRAALITLAFAILAAAVYFVVQYILSRIPPELLDLALSLIAVGVVVGEVALVYERSQNVKLPRLVKD
jgi:hypothetical protein